ncbi:response regulator [Sporosarcina sp. P18a]|uniref:response regulator transcription factor n=1 Tax=unclassified Sporosarcina TaxID=2647733 RepID=UPI000C172027|nr:MULTISPECIES: response regulator [unclassified Sporosarcina]PIC79526.1 response regulator [Sporosarcina sp. P18a]PID03427.1 response regulator [Sporosarcina sp. P2]
MIHVGKKVLVVDDEDILRMLLADTLEFEGFQVEEAEDGVEALEKIQSTSYDAILLDYMMPRMTGLELLERLQPLELTTPIIMLTAKAQQADQDVALAKGASYFVPKPFSPNELAELVKSLF